MIREVIELVENGKKMGLIEKVSLIVAKILVFLEEAKLWGAPSGGSSARRDLVGRLSTQLTYS